MSIVAAQETILRSRPPVNRPLLAGLLMLSLLLAVVWGGPYLIPYDPLRVDFGSALQPPNASTGSAPTISGAIYSRASSAPAESILRSPSSASPCRFSSGSLLGAVAGYFGGIVDRILSGLIDVLWAFPFLCPGDRHRRHARPLDRQSLSCLHPGRMDLVRPHRARRGLVVRETEYVTAARLLGLSHVRIILLHVLPNAISPAIVFAMADVVLTILAITSLSFLGLGVQPPKPEWGIMIADGRNFIFNAWWISTIPGLAIVYAGIAFSLLGDGLDTLLRPKG